MSFNQQKTHAGGDVTKVKNPKPPPKTKGLVFCFKSSCLKNHQSSGTDKQIEKNPKKQKKKRKREAQKGPAEEGARRR